MRALWSHLTAPLGYVCNGVTAVAVVVVCATGSTSAASLVAAAAVGAVYEFACRRAGHRLAWPWNTPGAAAFMRAQAHRDELAVLRAEGRRLDRLRAAVAAGRVDRTEAVRHHVTVTGVRRADGALVVTVDDGFGGHDDVFVDGERHRIVHDVSVDLSETGDPVLDPKRRELAEARRAVSRRTFRLPDSADAALFLDDLTERGGTLWIRRCVGEGTSVELADADGRRRFTSSR